MSEEIDIMYDDDYYQKKYENRVNELKKTFKKVFKGTYNPVLHDNPLEQLAQCEITIEQEEKRIQSGNIVDDTPEKRIQHARQHIRSIWSQLQIDMKGQRGDTKNVVMGSMKDFAEFAKERLYTEFDIDEEEEKDEKDEDSV